MGLSLAMSGRCGERATVCGEHDKGIASRGVSMRTSIELTRNCSGGTGGTNVSRPPLSLSVRGSAILDPSGAPVRLRGPWVGGWMNLEDFITGHPGAEHALRDDG
jgi:hypothetical protein